MCDQIILEQVIFTTGEECSTQAEDNTGFIFKITYNQKGEAEGTNKHWEDDAEFVTNDDWRQRENQELGTN